MLRPSPVLTCALSGALLLGCASRSVDVRPLPEDPATFAGWDCERIDEERDRVQQRAADVAYTVDDRASSNIVALGVGLAVFWPALLAMRPDGLEAADLARLKGRYEALQAAATRKDCPQPGAELPPARAAALAVSIGDRLVYEERAGVRGPLSEWSMRLIAMRRDGLDFELAPAGGGAPLPWRQDLAGNVTLAPSSKLQWRRLLPHQMELGQVVAGEMSIAGDLTAQARLRGQVVAVGPQSISERRFDAAVIELFGDALREESSTRIDGVVVVDRRSGVLLRLDLRSAQPAFSLQRRLARIEAAR